MRGGVHPADHGAADGAHDANKLKISTGAYWTYLCDEQLDVQADVGYWNWSRPSRSRLSRNRALSFEAKSSEQCRFEEKRSVAAVLLGRRRALDRVGRRSGLPSAKAPATAQITSGPQLDALLRPEASAAARSHRRSSGRSHCTCRARASSSPRNREC